jgi:hypothetical protein
MPTGRGLLPLADVADRQRRDGFPEPVIRCEHPVISMPVLPRRRDEIGEPVEELKRRELDDAIGSWPRGLPPTTPPDPVGGLVPREHVADAGDAAVWAADHGEPLEREGGAGAVSQKMLESLVGRRITTVAKCRHDVETAGGIYTDAPCVVDGNLVSGRTHHDNGRYLGPWIEQLLAATATVAAS